MSNRKTIVIIIVLVVILALCAAAGYFIWRTNSLENELKITQNKLDTTTSNLNSTIREFQSTKTTLAKTKEELDEANARIEQLYKDLESLQTEMYDSENAIGIVMSTEDINLLAKTVYGEARGESTMQQAAVVWNILNRVDAGRGTIRQVVTAKSQYTGYSSGNPVREDLKALVKDVLIRWQMEKVCIGEVGRVLPDDYLYFAAHNGDNRFRKQYKSRSYWDWSYYNPYQLTVQN